MNGLFGMIFALVTIAPAVPGLLRFDNSAFISSWYFALIMLLCVILCGVTTAVVSGQSSKR